MQGLINYLNLNKPLVVDIGAKDGPKDFLPILNHLKIYGFEPNEAEFNKLASTANITYFNCAVLDTNGQKEFYITKNASYSSFNKIDPDAYKKHFSDDPRLNKWLKNCEIEKSMMCNTIRLDDFCIEQKINFIDFLKLDTQGTELAILHGANKLLHGGKIGIIKTEFLFNPVYTKQAGFYELQNFLVNCGYELLSVSFIDPQHTDSKKPFLKGKRYYRYSKSNNGGDAYFIYKNIPAHDEEKIKQGILLAFLHHFYRSGLLLEKVEHKLPFKILELHAFAAKQSRRQIIKSVYNKIVPGILQK